MASFRAGVGAAAAIAAPAFPDTYAQLLVEKFLVAADDGWIYRQARYYRGAVQEEDEREGARALLTAMAGRDDWIGFRYTALRTGVRLLPHGADSGSAQKVRNMAAALSDRDPAFVPLRVKIHGTPGAADAAGVRSYASRVSDPALKKAAAELAAEIDRVYAPRPFANVLDEHARVSRRARGSALCATPQRLRGRCRPGEPLRVTAKLLATYTTRHRASSHLRHGCTCSTWRTRWRRSTSVPPPSPAHARRAPHAPPNVALLTRVSRPRTARRRQRHRATRVHGALGTWIAMRLPIGDYLRELRCLGLATGWGTQGLRLHFAEAMAKLGEIEPLAELFIQDQLRGSPLFFYSQRLDTLSRDANRAAPASSTSSSAGTSARASTRSTRASRGASCALPPT